MRRQIPDARYEMANARSPGRFGRSACTRVRQTKPIAAGVLSAAERIYIAVSGLKIGVGPKSKANFGDRSGQDLRFRISDLKSPNRDGSAGDWRQTKPISTFSGLKTWVGRRSKANRSQFGPSLIAHKSRGVCAAPECRGRANNR
jgi:hypothetical protein